MNDNGSSKTTYFKGTKQVFQIIEYKNGKKNGQMKEYYRNGNLRVQQTFINDQIHDTSTFYYENGKISSIQIIINNKKEKCWKKYTKEGVLHSDICFKNDQLDGPSTEYTYRSGRILKKVNYKEGIKHGKQAYYYNSGKPKSISYYNNGEPCRGTKEWSESGKDINNDFKITVEEQNKLLLENTLKFFIHLENPLPDDKVCLLYNNVPDTGRIVPCNYMLTRIQNKYVLDFSIARGSFIMEKLKIAAFRKTRMGNIVVKITSFNASANNF